MDRFFVVVYASFNLKCYDAMARIRIAQMRKRGIAFHFLVNGSIPDDLPLASNEYTLVDGPLTPHLFWAPKALQRFLQTFYKNEENEKYDYILRVNMSTFVCFERFLWMLQFLPKENCLAGNFFGRYEKIYLSGTVHLFSKDVAKYYAHEVTLNDTDCNTMTEDIVTSFALIGKYKPHDLHFFFHWADKGGPGYKTCEESHKIFESILPQHVFFRVRNDPDRDVVDPYIWMVLYNIFGQ